MGLTRSGWITRYSYEARIRLTWARSGLWGVALSRTVVVSFQSSGDCTQRVWDLETALRGIAVFSADAEIAVLAVQMEKSHCGRGCGGESCTSSASNRVAMWDIRFAKKSWTRPTEFVLVRLHDHGRPMLV